MRELVKINNVELGIKEFKNERVVTAWDIADLHEKQVYHVNEVFRNNIDKFQENRDFFKISTKEFLASFKTIQKIPNNVKEIFLFTERGYLKMTKAFNDELSWRIQDLLVDKYFKLKEIKTTIDKGKRLEIMEKNANVRMAKMLKSLIPYSKSERYKEILVSEATKVLTGRELIPPPVVEAKTVTASQIAKILGISANKIGKIANKYGLKNEEAGYWVHEKAKYCNKEIPNFRYFEYMIDEFRKYLNSEVA